MGTAVVRMEGRSGGGKDVWSVRKDRARNNNKKNIYESEAEGERLRGKTRKGKNRQRSYYTSCIAISAHRNTAR